MLPEEMRITFDDILERASDTAEMVQAAREFVKDPYGILTLWGGVGNGKTLVLYATINALRERGHEAAYVRFKDLLDWMRDGFANNDQRRRYKFLRTIDALAIDELDKARDTQYAQEFSTAFFDDRYRLAWAGRAVTLIAMNNDPHTLPAHIRDRLYDGRFNIVHNSDKSLRPHMTR
jgi:DNA replication protein DnaC